MILVLSFFVLIILFLIFGLLFSKIKINVKDFDLKMSKNELCKNNYEVNIGLYLFGKMKVFGINFEKDSFKFMGKKFNSQYIKNSKVYRQIIRPGVRDLDEKAILENLRKIYIKFEKFKLNLSLGTDSTLITSFLIFAVSTVISIIIKKGVTKYNPRKHSFAITPMYKNYNLIDIDLKCIISLKTINIIKIFADINKHAKNREKINKKSLMKKKHYPGYV